MRVIAIRETASVKNASVLEAVQSEPGSRSVPVRRRGRRHAGERRQRSAGGRRAGGPTPVPPAQRQESGRPVTPVSRSRRTAGSGGSQPERLVGEVGEALTDRRGELEPVAAEADADHDRSAPVEHEVVGGARRVEAHGRRTATGSTPAATRRRTPRSPRRPRARVGRASGSITGPVLCSPALTRPSGEPSP